MKAAGI